jgi:2-furoyl-CoA dehydrogenase large subunit
MTLPTPYRYVGTRRRTKEDRRFVGGQGRYVADVELPGTLHVAMVSSPWPSARIAGMDLDVARAAPGVHAVLTGAELAAGTRSMPHGLILPGIRWYPLAHERVRYAGEWVVAVVAESRALAEDAAGLVDIDYEPMDAVLDAEQAYAGGTLVHPDHGSNVLYDRTFVWREVERDFQAAEHRIAHSVRWGRNATVPIETFGAQARFDAGNGLLDVWASVQMPKYSENIASCLQLAHNAVRVHYDVDVGGSYGVKRGLKHAVLVGFLARRLGRPVRFLEDRLENMSGGDAHGPDRRFDIEAAFDGDGVVRALKIRAIDDCGAWPGRAPLQLGKPVGAIVGPYRINSVEYHAISVCTNKTGQVPVRGFGQAPTNLALEATMDRIARFLDMDPVELRRRNYIGKEQFPYAIPSGTEYDSGDYHAVHDEMLALAGEQDFTARRDALRAQGLLAGIGFAACLEPSGGNAAFEPLLNPDNDTTTWMESCLVRVDRGGLVTAAIATPTAGQGHETLMATVIGEELGMAPEGIRVVHSDTLIALPGNTPVASRMAVMMGGAAAGAAASIRADVLRIAAHVLQLPADRLRYEAGDVMVEDDPARRLPWKEIVGIAHRQYHRMPPGMQPGLQSQFVYQVPKGLRLPTADGRVQMYPCYAFEAHMPLVSIDPLTGRVNIEDYIMGHDCGTQINPDIVRGMMMGGLAHGIGAALYEEFVYDADGQLLSGSLLDYPMPSTLEVPTPHLVERCTPSPLTSFGQKGSGEAGYMGAPAGIASAVNDALRPLGLERWTLPLRASELSDLIHSR